MGHKQTSLLLFSQALSRRGQFTRTEAMDYCLEREGKRDGPTRFRQRSLDEQLAGARHDQTLQVIICQSERGAAFEDHYVPGM